MGVMLVPYEKLPRRLAQWADPIDAAARCYKLDPLILAAIMDRESLGGEALEPRGPHGKGDRGKGFGLMQIDIGSHRAFLEARFDDGKPLWMDPYFSVGYGAKLLRRNLDALKGRLPGAIAAYNSGLTRVTRIVRALPLNVTLEALVKAVDAVTHNHDYVADVLARFAKFQKLVGMPVGPTPGGVPSV